MVQVSNQIPCQLPLPEPPQVDADYEPMENLKHLLKTILGSGSVHVGANQLDLDELATRIAATDSHAVDPQSEDFAHEFYRQCLLHYGGTQIPADMALINQAMARLKWPMPSNRVVYTVDTDLIPAAKVARADLDAHKDELAAALAMCRPVSALNVALLDKSAFAQVTSRVQALRSQFQSEITADDHKRLKQFCALPNTDIVDRIVLRDPNGGGLSAYSAELVIHQAIMDAANQVPDQVALLPVSLGQLIMPTDLVFVNVDLLSHANPSAINKAFQLIEAAPALSTVSLKNIMSLATMARVRKKAGDAAGRLLKSRPGDDSNRASNVPFSTKAPTNAQLLKRIEGALARMENVNRSQNPLKSVRATFQRPSRRNPDDYNLKGKAVSTKYRPDIHLYVDTSGSISEDNYEQAVKLAISIARKFNTNLFFSSFATELSEATRVPLQNKSARQCYRYISAIPKVTGWTYYQNVWTAINRSRTRRRQLSIMITDFEFRAPYNWNQPHPEHLIYLPCANMDFKDMAYHARKFCESMRYIDPGVRSKVLF